LCVAVAGFIAVQPLFWTFPTAYLRGAAAAPGLALVNVMGALAGFFSPGYRLWADTRFGAGAGLYALGVSTLLGAAMIALACLESRRPVSVVCDHHTQALVEACLTELSGPTAVFDVTFFSFEPGNAARVALRCRQIATILTGGGRMPLIIPIETAGRTADGIARSMRGIDITAFNPNFDQLAAELLQVKCPMLAIGDGGNELGMGAVTGVPPATNGLPMQADFAAHFVVKATVSNWGGYFLYATDKLLRGQGDQMPRVDQHDRAIGEMLRLGAVDGFTLSSDPTFISAEGRPTAVDGLPLSTHSEVWSKCLDFAQSPIQRH